MEWFRSRLAACPSGIKACRVLSVENGSPEYDADLVRQLVPKVEDLKCVAAP